MKDFDNQKIRIALFVISHTRKKTVFVFLLFVQITEQFGKWAPFDIVVELIVMQA